MGRWSVRVTPLGFLAVVALGAYLLLNAVPTYGLILWTKEGAGWVAPARFNSGVMPGWAEPVVLAAGGLSLFALAGYMLTRRLRGACRST